MNFLKKVQSKTLIKVLFKLFQKFVGCGVKPRGFIILQQPFFATNMCQPACLFMKTLVNFH
jgi:hypothetical protein